MTEVQIQKKGEDNVEKVQSHTGLIGDAFKEQNQKVSEALTLCKNISAIVSDNDNSGAREVAKEANDIVKSINKARLTLNKPLKDRIDSNNKMAKLLTDPLSLEIDRLKLLIGSYETKKEAERQASLRKAEEERLKREEAERKTREEAERVRNSINSFYEEQAAKIDECRTMKTLEKYEQEIKEKKASKGEYGNHVDLMKDAIEKLKSKIKFRKDFVKDLEKKDADDKKKAVEEESFRQQQAQQQEEVQEEHSEMYAEQDLITLVASIHSDDSDWKVEEKIEELKQKYGGAANAVKQREKIITDEQAAQEESRKLKELKGDKVRNQRKDFKFRIMDETKIPREYLKVDEAKIREAIIAKKKELQEDLNAFGIEGVEIYEEAQTVLR